MQMVLKRLALAAVSDKRVRDSVLAILLGFLLFAEKGNSAHIRLAKSAYHTQER